MTYNQRQLNNGQQGDGSGLDADKFDGREDSGIEITNFDGSSLGSGEFLKYDGNNLVGSSVSSSDYSFTALDSSNYDLTDVDLTGVSATQVIIVYGTSGTNNSPAITVDNDTSSSYEYTQYSGNEVTGASDMPLGSGNSTGVLVLTAVPNRGIVAVELDGYGAGGNMMDSGAYQHYTYSSSYTISNVTISGQSDGGIQEVYYK